MSELTKRQWRLYNYLKAATGYVTQYELALNLETEYPTTQKDLQDFHNCKARKDMTADIRAINKSDIIQKMIIANAKGVKLATEAEAERYIKARYASIFRQLERARKIERKAGLDGQFKLVFGSEREIVQAFTDSNEIGTRWHNRRKAAGMTQKQAVALMREYCKIDEPTLSRIEHGTGLPTQEQQAAFEKVYR